ncbi:ubiquinone/menaquinone biosynthesis methyltransferase [Desulfovibrio ferrophilus]|uniref:Demethylmenaquinone methyltransferase n=1 Tax=Desulfovibrio ferrophilus TaxID=241368 RepID=A0A2Z6B2M2_9BACT|nr:ubiquinone/menaquinone biosynthesis methyltransferase [Desulfovibrio ferrophilus]BBD09688.1 ubiquinone/menaquinone biosynthesis methyltransferase [Desulfovibrio ferrophilus]
MMKNDPREQAGRVSGMFGRISGWYDFLNHFLSLGMDILWRRKLVKTVRPGPTGRFLDLAAGTMDVTCELKRRYPEARILAMDFSLPMLEQGKPKLESFKYDVQPVLADGRLLPLPDKSVDAVTIAFGIRNIRPRSEAYAEILRTLAPGGRLAILEFGSSSRPIWKGIYNFYLNTLLPLAGRIISGDRQAYQYLADTIADFPTATALEDELRDAGFVNVSHEAILSGIVNIHVAERRIFEGDTFVVGAPPKSKPSPAPAKTKKTVTPKAAAKSATEAAPAPQAGQTITRRAANLEAGLQAMDKAVQSVKQAKKKKAPAKVATQKTPAKKTAAKKSPKEKAAPKKTAATKTSTAKKTTNKTETKKKTAAADKTSSPKATPKKSTAKKATPKPKKAAAKKSAAKDKKK